VSVPLNVCKFFVLNSCLSPICISIGPLHYLGKFAPRLPVTPGIVHKLVQKEAIEKYERDDLVP
jgi:hypothetical protein